MWFRRIIIPQFQKVACFPCNFEWVIIPNFYSTKAMKKGKAAPLQERRMIDKFKIWAKGGDGGNGCWSIRRSRTDWRGKPDGGNGGRGGSVILECSDAVWDFSNLQHHLNAKRGGHGLSKKMAGTRGSDRIVQVPVGTVIHLVSGQEPQILEKTCTTNLQPWEIPETDEVVQAETDRQKSDGKKVVRTDKLDVGQLAHSPLHSGQINCIPGVTDDTGKCPPNSSENLLQKEILPYFEGDEIIDGDEKNSDVISGMESEGQEVIQHSVAELTEPGQKLVIACGGKGGFGNANVGKVHNILGKFKHQETHEVLNDEASITAGLPGSESVLILELKSIADVGLVGMPNAGKSTLLGAISRAKPAVGDYAFTTLRPNIGKLNYADCFSMTVADIPGIIKGAHENRGLGHAFLRHIERTKVLAYVVDLGAALEGKKGMPPWEQLNDLVLELEYHQEGLSNRPSLIVANKIDEKGAEDVYEELKRRVKGVPIFPVCAVLEEGIPELKDGLRSLLNGCDSEGLELKNISVD